MDLSTGETLPVTNTSFETKSLYFVSDHATNVLWNQDNMSSGEIVWIKDVSLKEVLQSADLSDTYPDIIDVNEPVLGAELVTNGAFATVSDGTHGYDNGNGTVDGWTAANGAVLSIASNKLKVLHGGSDANPNAYYDFTSTTGKTYFASVAYDISNCNSIKFALDEGNSTTISSGTTGTLTHTFVAASTGSRSIYLAANCDASEYALFDDFTLKEVQGNTGTMTNQAAGDLVYSSVLPDQSFLTGVNSAYNYIDLDGGDQYIDCGADVHDFSSGDFTITAWIYHDTANTDHAGIVGIRGSNTELQFYVRNGGGDDNKLASWNNSDNVYSSSTIADEEWTHVGLVQSGGNKKFYINGALDNTASQSNGTADSTSLKIGYTGSGSEYFLGRIGGLGVWSKELSASEISAIYNLGRHGNLLDSYSDNLLGYYAMSALDASTGLSDSISTIYDRSGNSNHGTPTNADAGDLASSPNADPNGYAKGDTNRSTDVK